MIYWYSVFVTWVPLISTNRHHFSFFPLNGFFDQLKSLVLHRHYTHLFNFDLEENLNFNSRFRLFFCIHWVPIEALNSFTAQLRNHFKSWLFFICVLILTSSSEFSSHPSPYFGLILIDKLIFNCQENQIKCFFDFNIQFSDYPILEFTRPSILLSKSCH